MIFQILMPYIHFIFHLYVLLLTIEYASFVWYPHQLTFIERLNIIIILHFNIA